MLTDITIGQYFPGDSVLHRMDPRIKIVLLFFLIVGIFVFDTRGAYAVMSAFTLLLMVLSRVPLRMMARSVKPLWWILAFTFLVHLCSTPGRFLPKSGFLILHMPVFGRDSLFVCGWCC